MNKKCLMNSKRNNIRTQHHEKNKYFRNASTKIYLFPNEREMK